MRVSQARQQKTVTCDQLTKDELDTNFAHAARFKKEKNEYSVNGIKFAIATKSKRAIIMLIIWNKPDYLAVFEWKEHFSGNL